MQIKVLNKETITDISDRLLEKDGSLILHPASFYRNIPFDDLRYFCHLHARYSIPTVESIDFIQDVINGRGAIEIGAGHGDTGLHLGIVRTDSKLQEETLIRHKYDSMQQPVIKYPWDVEKLEALKAVDKYRPKVVVASWITTFSKKYTPHYNSSPFGVKEKSILKMVETFILIGSVEIHGTKPIMQLSHDETMAEWLFSRKPVQENRIWIWNR